MTNHSGTIRTTLLLTVTGRDKPGVVSVIFSALTRHGVDILDVEQVVIQGRIILGVLVETTADPEDLQEAAEQAMASIGMQVEVEVGADAVGASARGSTHVVLVLGRPVTARAFTETTRALAALNINIDAIRRIADYPVTGLELLVSVPSNDNPRVADTALRSTMVRLAAHSAIDLAVEQVGIARRAKRLVVFDVNSTLVQGEVIEMLAEHAGAAVEVRAVTEAAMRGELDFTQSLRRRVALLAGLPASVLTEVINEVELTPGAGPRYGPSSGWDSAAAPCRAASPRSCDQSPRTWGWTSAPPTSWRSAMESSLAGSSARWWIGPGRLTRCAGRRSALGSRWPSVSRSGTAQTTSTCSPPLAWASRSMPNPRCGKSRTPRLTSRSWTSCCSCWA